MKLNKEMKKKVMDYDPLKELRSYRAQEDSEEKDSVEAGTLMMTWESVITQSKDTRVRKLNFLHSQRRNFACYYELPSEFVYRHENDKLDEESGEHDNSDESPDSETVTEEDNEDEEREDTQEKEEEPNIKQLKHASKDGRGNHEGHIARGRGARGREVRGRFI
ncbi:hypothetical protein DAPPUDRAFT_334010 [Daphnia pulex]|uniref:Uncharacterized protein n=1 Tax=Daphnia pulex TaxID=6669 RepID=E9HUG3_DAPPU|nr:hypothetical protein DAPPUDRAFT_334010 [Daphnia pulex]|eukprot:EFX64618.1 hypothetical protein DAPPUDRAFT_334010 [Daphnia pulex]